MKSDEGTPNQLWWNIDKYKFAEGESRQVVRRFHIGRWVAADVAAANLADAIAFAGMQFSKSETQQP